MDRRSFNRLAFPFKVMEKKAINYSEMTLNLTIMRFNVRNLEYSDNLMITPNNLYYNNIIKEWLEINEMSLDQFMNDLINSKEGEYIYETDDIMYLDKSTAITNISRKCISYRNFPDYPEDIAIKLKLNSCPMDYDWYSKLVWLVDMKRTNKISRYTLTADEIESFHYNDLKEWNWPFRKATENILDMSYKNNKVRELLRMYQETIFDFKPSRRKESTLTLQSDYQTIFSEFHGETLTYARLKFWEMTRHNLFGEIVCEHMGWEFNNNFDVNVSEKFNYYGPHYYKTPDLVLEMDNKKMILDFAVTNANAGRIRDNKKEKYEDLRSGLSKHLKMDVSCEAIVWKINSDFEFQIPPEFQNLNNLLRFDERMIKLKELQIGFMLMKDYHKYKTMLDREGEDEENNDDSVLDISEKLYKELDSRYSHEEKLRSIPLENSRAEKPDLYCKPMRFCETEFSKELEEFNARFKETDFNPYLVDELQKMLEKGEMNDELRNMFENTNEDLEDKAKKMMDEETQKRKAFNMDSNNNMPSIFKFPLMEFSKRKSKNMEYFSGVTPDFWNSTNMTEDGTYYYTETMDYNEQKNIETMSKNLPYNTDGIGIDEEEDKNMVDTLIDYFMEEDTDANMEPQYMDYPDLDDLMKDVLKSKLWTYVCSIGELMENLCYMESRRHIFDSGKGHTIFKNFGEYMILMKKGSKITQEKQVRYKIYLPNDLDLNPKDGLFKSAKPSAESNMLNCTKWLAITVADIKHFVKIREVVLAMFSNYRDKMLEENRATGLTTTLLTRSMISQCLILLEHRRGTSTSSQLSRYLLNSVTSFASNKNKLLEDIMSDPIRSRLEAYVRASQVNWYVSCMRLNNDVWYNRILSMASTSTDYDRFKLPSFYDPDEQVEFSILMDEIYSCNLFEKSSGFQSHRMKRIVEKMSVAEQHFHKVKKLGRSKGKMDSIRNFLTSKDELHMFSRKVVVAATRKYFDSNSNKVKINTAFLESMSEVIDNAMMMTSSLEAGPLSSEALRYNNEIQKSKSFITIYKSVCQLSTNNLMNLCEKMDIMDAIFTIFPKDQIGGAREILIQSIMTRLFVKYLETLSKKLCSKHEKEMLTKDRKKAEIQADRMSDYRETLKMLRQKGEASIYASLNSDASKWAPGFVMEHFSYFVSNWGLDKNTNALMMNILSSFGNKKIMMPESLKKKWNKKDKNEKEYLQGVQYMRDMSDESFGTVLINSGMGQGMLHFLSSLYHCIMDDYMEDIMEKVLYRTHGVLLHQTSLISSDDKTKMFIMIYKNGINNSDEALKSYLKLVDWLSRLTNIHTNWKKSGLNFVITEFNSLFSVGRRMQWATIKDIYTANSIPDLTSPEEAVVFMNSNIRRCLEHGVYLTTVKLLMWMARQQLIRYYRLNNEVMEAMMKKLNCTREKLPYQLGFYNIEMPVETLLYGMEVTMFTKDMSPELEKFYFNLYSHEAGENFKTSKKTVPFSEVCMGKYWYELPMRLDKRLSDLRNEFFNDDLGMNSDQIMESSNHRKMCYNSPMSDMKHFETFSEEFFVGMRRKYEFQETMVVHSLIRALQTSTSKGTKYPMTEKEELIREEYQNALRMYKSKDKKNTLTAEDMEFFESKYNEIKKMSMDLIDFCNYISNLTTNKSSIVMYSGLKEVSNLHYEIQDMLKGMEKTKKFSHATMRTMRFYMTDIGMSAKKEEIVDFFFDRNKDFRSSTLDTVVKLLDMAGIKMEKSLFSNPFKTIKDIVSGAKYPNKVFMEFLHLNYRSMKFMKMNMLSDLPCEGNMRSNLINLYRTKSNPSFFLMPRDNDFLREDTSLEFLTNVSLNQPMRMKEIPEHYSVISASDNLFMKTMKLHSISKGDWKNPLTVRYERLEYSKTYNRMRDTTFYAWTTMSTLIKAEETKKNVMISINTIYDLNKDSTDDRIFMVLNRFILDRKSEGKTIRFMHKEKMTSDGNLMYRKCELHWRTLVQRTTTLWRIRLIVEAGLGVEHSEDIANLNRADFRLFKDSYTVDSRTLMDLVILNEYDEQIRVKELYVEVPDLVSLDKIFMKNNWIKQIEMRVGEDMDSETKYSVKELNKSFGITSLDTTISHLFSGNEAWKKVEELKMTDSLNMDTMNNTIMNVETENLAIPDQTITNSVMRALKTVEENKDNLVIEINPYERNSIVKNVDQLVSHSIKTTLNIHKDSMKQAYKYSKGDPNKLLKFHNLLLWQIQKATDFEMSDTMSIIVYNHILKSSSTILNTKPSDQLKKMPEDFNMPAGAIFIKKYVYYDEDLEDIYSRMS
jgi:hypothetical protein